MMVLILTGDKSQSGKMPEIQKKYADCLPDLNIRKI
jgi:hypothetical protein